MSMRTTMNSLEFLWAFRVKQVSNSHFNKLFLHRKNTDSIPRLLGYQDKFSLVLWFKTDIRFYRRSSRVWWCLAWWQINSLDYKCWCWIPRKYRNKSQFWWYYKRACRNHYWISWWAGRCHYWVPRWMGHPYRNGPVRWNSVLLSHSYWWHWNDFWSTY